MTTKLTSIVAVSAAVIAAAVAAVVVSLNRANEAQALADKAAAVADRKAAEAKQARAEADAEASKKAAAEAARKAKADELTAAKLANETAKLEAQEAADRKKAAEASARDSQAKAAEARSNHDAERAKAETASAEQQKAKAQAAAEASKADAESAKLAIEKIKADKILAEAKVLELRKTDFETLERELLAWKLDLEERERALQPEKTIADLSWAGGMEDSVMDENGNILKKPKTVYDPEKDSSLPASSRRLARAQRRIREAHTNIVELTRESEILPLERLYVQALKDGRVIDADFYRKSILTMDPSWKLKDVE